MISVRKSDDMSSLLSEFLLEFAKTIRIDTWVSNYLLAENLWMIGLGLLACVFGFYVYRVCFSTLLFIGIAEGLCLVMSKEPWGNVAVYIAVLGTVFGFLAFRWHRFGGFVICAAVGACMGYACHPSIAIALLCAAVAGIAELYFPVITICGMTSLWGAWLLADIAWREKAYYGWLFAGTAIVSLLWQLFMNRKQKIFAKPYPDKVRYWLEKRRCA